MERGCVRERDGERLCERERWREGVGEMEIGYEKDGESVVERGCGREMERGCVR